MNYTRLYNEIVESRVRNPIKCGYTEKHHIIPRSLGGSNCKDNIVTLTAREHFLCHWLLLKMQVVGSPEYHKMLLAFVMMSYCQSDNQRRYNSKAYEYYRGRHSSSMSVLQSGNSNSQYGRIWIYNVELEVSKKIYRDESIPIGWERGRKIDFNHARLREQSRVDDINRKAEEEEGRRIHYNELYETFLLSGYNSLRGFANSHLYSKSHVSLIKNFKKYVAGFKTCHGRSYVSK